MMSPIERDCSLDRAKQVLGPRAGRAPILECDLLGCRNELRRRFRTSTGEDPPPGMIRSLIRSCQAKAYRRRWLLPSRLRGSARLRSEKGSPGLRGWSARWLQPVHPASVGPMNRMKTKTQPVGAAALLDRVRPSPDPGPDSVPRCKAMHPYPDPDPVLFSGLISHWLMRMTLISCTCQGSNVPAIRLPILCPMSRQQWRMKMKTAMRPRMTMSSSCRPTCDQPVQVLRESPPPGRAQDPSHHPY